MKEIIFLPKWYGLRFFWYTLYILVDVKSAGSIANRLSHFVTDFHILKTAFAVIIYYTDCTIGKRSHNDE